MDAKINYGKILEKTIEELGDKRPKLLLHSCCAPCSSYVLEYLTRYFDITLSYYNPNITRRDEFELRASEQERLLREADFAQSVKLLTPEFDCAPFSEISRGLENEPEGGKRCELCYILRLRHTYELAVSDGGFNYFCTTLSVSPYKNAEKLNRIGGGLAKQGGVDYLFSDFKKRGGYKRSIELSRQYSLYRQNYCGCIYSQREALEKNK